jgi:dienelactone hydrolase
MADQYAANGYYTLIPDLFNGDALSINRPEGFDLMGWLNNGSTGDNPHTFGAVDPIIQKSIEYLQQKGFKKIGAVGYCFGAKYVVRFMPKGKGIDAGFVAHPSYVSLFSLPFASQTNNSRFVEESELLAINGPLSIAAAETDPIFPAEKRHRSETILMETKQPFQINLYSGVSHGFSVRCDTSKKIEKYSKDQAFLQAVTWFDEHLVHASSSKL